MELQNTLTKERENGIQSLLPQDLVSVTGFIETLAKYVELHLIHVFVTV